MSHLEKHLHPSSDASRVTDNQFCFTQPRLAEANSCHAVTSSWFLNRGGKGCIDFMMPAPLFFSINADSSLNFAGFYVPQKCRKNKNHQALPMNKSAHWIEIKQSKPLLNDEVEIQAKKGEETMTSMWWLKIFSKLYFLIIPKFLVSSEELSPCRWMWYFWDRIFGCHGVVS